MPSVPAYNIERLNFHDGLNQSVEADVSISVHNDYPIGLTIPPLGFEILVPNCDHTQKKIVVAEAITDPVDVHPNADVIANATGTIGHISKSLTRACPKTQLSPLDKFMQRYLRGEDAEIFVRGKRLENSDTPEWINVILESITVPLEFPGSSFGNLIRNFTLEDVDFQLPSPFADPGDPDSQALVSGTVHVLAALPPEMKVDLGVKGLQSTADLFYDEKKMGELNLDHWNPANSTQLVVDNENLLNITSTILNVPLNVTDGDVFGDVMQKVLFGNGDVLLDVVAAVDVKVDTPLGDIVIKGVPATGKVPVKRPSPW